VGVRGEETAEWQLRQGSRRAAGATTSGEVAAKQQIQRCIPHEPDLHKPPTHLKYTPIEQARAPFKTGRVESSS